MKRHIIFCLSLTLYSYLLNAQGFRNLDFEQLCDTSKTGLCHWDLSWGAENSCRPDNVNGNSVLLIELSSGVGWTEQVLDVNQTEEISVFSVTANIKTREVAEKGAGLNVGIYDSEGNLLVSKDSGKYGNRGWITESNEWQKVQIDIIAPIGTSSIKIGAILYGKGTAWFDDFEVDIQSTGKRRASKLARQYISAAIDTVGTHSLHKDSVDLTVVKKYALQIAGNAKKYADCHLAIEYLLNALEDHHSFFMDAEAVRAWDGSDVEYDAEIEMPTSQLVADYGYVLVPPFHGGDSVLIDKYARHMQNVLSAVYEKNINGWIIDLRQNTGGNMEPMIAGLGPVFDSKVLGHLVDVYGGKEAWIYDNGKYMWDDEVAMSLPSPITLKKQLPIAVLMSHQTGSSGEIVLISFIGNSNTRTFGQSSWGLTTGNGDFELADGSRMFLASTRMADRNGNVFYGPIKPDTFIEESEDKNQDPVMDAAIKWLNQMVDDDKN